MVSNLMVAQPPKAVGAAAEYPFSVKLQQKFVMLSRFGEAVPLYKIRTGSIYLPRAVCPEPHPSNDNRTFGQPVSFACTATPRNDEQAMVVAETLDFLEAGLSGIVQASTGFGKTVIGMMVAARLGLPTLIVVTKEDLLKQWVEAVEKFLGLDRQTGYGIIQGDTCDVAGKPVGIAMIHSIAKEGRYPSWAYDQWGLVIFDECITGEAMIDLYPTRQIRMDELATRVQGGETFEVWSYDKALDTFVVQTVSHSWTKGTRPILEVELEDGRTLRCTPEHLLMTTNRGWVRAGDLTTEDDVMELDL
jgi:hypothetical protein